MIMETLNEWEGKNQKIRNLMKILAVGAGMFFFALMYLELRNIVNINWDKPGYNVRAVIN